MLQVKEIASKFDIDKDLPTMLSFYHDLGTIIYFGNIDDTFSSLKDIIILNPQWLIDVFKKVITVSDPNKWVNKPKYYNNELGFTNR